MHSRHASQLTPRRSLSFAIALGLGLVTTAAFAQSTVGAVYGTADAGAEVTATNTGSGLSRSTTVGSDDPSVWAAPARERSGGRSRAERMRVGALNMAFWVR